MSREYTKHEIVLTADERKTLRDFVRKGNNPSMIIRRANVILSVDKSQNNPKSNDEAAEIYHLAKSSVCKMKKDFLELGIDEFLHRKQRETPPIEPKITGEVEAGIMQIACSEPPEGHSRWTIRLIAKRAVELHIIDSISTGSVCEILNKNEMKPHLSRYWAIPKEHSARFVAKMEDVLAVYAREYDPKKPMICMDEKPLQFLGEARKRFRCDDGSMTIDCEYVRNGTCAIFMFVEPLTGFMRVQALDHRTKIDWAHQMKIVIDECYPDAEKLVFVMDNLNTHDISSFYEAFEPEEASRLASKLEIHYTPEHGSWLDMAEIALSVLSHECLGNRRFENMSVLENELAAWMKEHNENRRKINWQFKATDARIKLRHLYPDLNSV